MHNTKDYDYPETIITKALGLVDFSVEVYYAENIDEDLFFLSENSDIYAISDGSALFFYKCLTLSALKY